MNKAQLGDRLHHKFPAHYKRDMETVVEIVFRAMTKALAEHRRIEIRGFGAFSLHSQKGRVFINPKTKKISSCKESKRIIFKPGKALKDSLN